MRGSNQQDRKCLGPLGDFSLPYSLSSKTYLHCFQIYYEQIRPTNTTVNITTNESGHFVTHYTSHASVNNKYIVTNELQYEVYFGLCPNRDFSNSMNFEGTIAFHNPYGYIPADNFGKLPFVVRIKLFILKISN